VSALRNLIIDDVTTGCPVLWQKCIRVHTDGVSSGFKTPASGAHVMFPYLNENYPKI